MNILSSRANRKSSFLLLHLIFFLFAFSFINFGVSANSKLTSHSGRIVYFFGNEQKAEAFCLGKSISKLNSIYFKSPSGVKISMNLVQNYLTGYIYSFRYIKGKNTFEFKYTINLLFAEQGFLIPVSASFNKVYVVGLIDLADGGNSERLFNSKLLKEFFNLPLEFQAGLKDFYLFLGDSSSGTETMAVSLNSLFEKTTPYKVKHFVAPKSNQIVIEEFLSGFSQF